MSKLLEGKYAIITGAARGIGAEIARTFARSGVGGIVIADIIVEEAEKTCNSIKESTGCDCIFLKTDVSDYENIKSTFNTALNKFGTLDALVNCAGVCPVGTIEEIGEKEWDKVMAINLKSTYLCSREAFMIMKTKNYGKIINFSSISGRIGGIATGVNYAASKGAIVSLTMSFAKAAGPYNINVNCVAPGFINTEMTKNFTHFDTNTVPLRRIGTTEDVANVIEFLASEKSSYLTGVTIDINGGVFMST